MGVTVHGDYPDMAGIYDLVGVITGSDPAWGIADGSLQTAVLTIEHSPDSPRFTGTFPRFCFTDWNGESCNQTPGAVSGVIDHRGRVVIELTFEGSQSSYLYGGRGVGFRADRGNLWRRGAHLRQLYRRPQAGMIGRSPASSSRPHPEPIRNSCPLRGPEHIRHGTRVPWPRTMHAPPLPAPRATPMPIGSRRGGEDRRAGGDPDR